MNRIPPDLSRGRADCLLVVEHYVEGECYSIFFRKKTFAIQNKKTPDSVLNRAFSMKILDFIRG